MRAALVIALMLAGVGSAHADPADLGETRWRWVLIVTPKVETDVDAVLRWTPPPEDEQHAVVLLPEVLDRAWDAVGWSPHRQRPDLRAGARDGGVQLLVAWRF